MGGVNGLANLQQRLAKEPLADTPKVGAVHLSFVTSIAARKTNLKCTYTSL